MGFHITSPLETALGLLTDEMTTQYNGYATIIKIIVSRINTAISKTTSSLQRFVLFLFKDFTSVSFFIFPLLLP
jgi:hypothetical protein